MSFQFTKITSIFLKSFPLLVVNDLGEYIWLFYLLGYQFILSLILFLFENSFQYDQQSVQDLAMELFPILVHVAY